MICTIELIGDRCNATTEQQLRKKNNEENVPRTSIKMCIHNLTNPFIVLHGVCCDLFEMINDTVWKFYFYYYLSLPKHFDDCVCVCLCVCKIKNEHRTFNGQFNVCILSTEQKTCVHKFSLFLL